MASSSMVSTLVYAAGFRLSGRVPLGQVMVSLSILCAEPEAEVDAGVVGGEIAGARYTLVLLMLPPATISTWAPMPSRLDLWPIRFSVIQ